MDAQTPNTAQLLTMDYAPNICRPSGSVIEFHVDTRNTDPLLHFLFYLNLNFLHFEVILDDTALDRSWTYKPTNQPPNHPPTWLTDWRGELFYFENRNSSTWFLANWLILTAASASTTPRPESSLLWHGHPDTNTRHSIRFYAGVCLCAAPEL